VSGQTTVVVSYTTSTLVVEDVELGATVVVEVQSAPCLQVLNAGIQGPKGDSGTGQPTRVDFSAGATWSGTHSLGRVPIVFVYLPDGSAIIADVSATDFNFTVVHASPRSGFVLLF
jgi:hypothetical protein